MGKISLNKFHVTHYIYSSIKKLIKYQSFWVYNTIPCNKSNWLIFSWAAAAVCWQSAGCDGIGPTQTSPAFYWLQLHMRRCDILTEFRVCCSSVRMKQLQFLFSNNRGPEVFWGIMTLIIICHQNDNDHHHHWDETLRTVPVASESIRFYMSTYSAHYTLIYYHDISLNLYLPGLYDSVKEELRSRLGVSCSDTGAMLGVRVSTWW